MLPTNRSDKNDGRSHGHWCGQSTRVRHRTRDNSRLGCRAATSPGKLHCDAVSFFSTRVCLVGVQCIAGLASFYWDLSFSWSRKKLFTQTMRESCCRHRHTLTTHVPKGSKQNQTPWTCFTGRHGIRSTANVNSSEWISSVVVFPHTLSQADL